MEVIEFDKAFNCPIGKFLNTMNWNDSSWTQYDRIMKQNKEAENAINIIENDSGTDSSSGLNIRVTPEETIIKSYEAKKNVLKFWKVLLT